ncbi:hypothetical protein VTH06DRAFT_921, partial [Thermothelomyces fergusii]
RLQRAAAGGPSAQQPLSTSRHVTAPTSAFPSPAGADADAAGATFSGGVRMGAPPEFEGDRNPVTGEIGGPKNEPLRWGSQGDWSFNGRVTDF